MKTLAATYPIYADASGETWRPADDTAHGRNWLRCVETDRGARSLASVDREFGPLTIRDAGLACPVLYRDPVAPHSVHSCAREAHSLEVMHWNGQDSWGRRQWLDDDPEAVKPAGAQP